MSAISFTAICLLISFTVVNSEVLEYKLPEDFDLMCYELNRNRTLELCSIMTTHKDQNLNDFCRKEQDYYGCLFTKMDKFCGDHCAHLMVKSIPLSLGKEATDMTMWDDYRYPKCAKLVDMWDRGSSSALSIQTITYALVALLWIRIVFRGKEATGKDAFWNVEYLYPNCPKLVDMWDRGTALALSIQTITYALVALLWVVFSLRNT